MKTKREENVFLIGHSIVKKIRKINERKVQVELFNLKLDEIGDYKLKTNKGEYIETDSDDLSDPYNVNLHEANMNLKKKFEIDEIVFSKYAMCYFNTCINSNTFVNKFTKAIHWKNLIDDLDVITHYYTRGDLIRTLDLYFEGLLDIIIDNNLIIEINKDLITNIDEVVEKLYLLEEYKKITERLIVGERNNNLSKTITGLHVPKELECINKEKNIYEYEIPMFFFRLGLIIYIFKIYCTDEKKYDKKYKKIVKTKNKLSNNFLLEVIDKNNTGFLIKDYSYYEINTCSRRKIQGKPLHCNSPLFVYYKDTINRYK